VRRTAGLDRFLQFGFQRTAEFFYDADCFLFQLRLVGLGGRQALQVK
jgi:hypothetical protein